jgi:hypothetical protein
MLLQQQLLQPHLISSSSFPFSLFLLPLLLQLSYTFRKLQTCRALRDKNTTVNSTINLGCTQRDRERGEKRSDSLHKREREREEGNERGE